MARVEWPGIPEAYWPDTDKPWRTTWGFGAFKDFATKEEAEAESVRLRKHFKNGWEDLVQDPFNVIEVNE